MALTVPFGSQNGPFSAGSDRDQADSNPNHVDIDVDAGENDRWGPEWVELDLDTQPMVRLAPSPEREYPDLKTAKDLVQQWAMEHRYAVRSGVRRGRAGEFTRCCDRAGRYLDRR